MPLLPTARSVSHSTPAQFSSAVSAGVHRFPAVAWPQNDAATLAKAAMVEGDAAFHRGDFAGATARYSECIRLQPREAEYYYKAGIAAWNAGEMELAETHLLETAFLRPQHAPVHSALALWFVQKGQTSQALEHSAAAMALDPGNSEYTITHAGSLVAAGRESEAWTLIEPLIASGVLHPWLVKHYATMAPKLGHEAQAIAYVERAIRELSAADRDRSRYHFLAAGLLDRVGRYDEAFAHAQRGSRFGGHTHDPAAHSWQIGQSIRYFSKRRLQSLPRATHGNSRPVFIVGMPRSGTSLVEQILASHPGVHGAGELRAFSQVIEAATKAPWADDKVYPACFESASIRHLNQLASKYLESIGSINSTATYVTDKMPVNFLYLGAIELLFPECRIIHCKRDPRDTCLSCYFTDFSIGYGCTFDLGHLASYYRDYQRLMDHFKTVAGVKMLEVSYEELVADQAGQTRRMLDFLELPWDDRCLSFHQSNRSMPTASRHQVRQPMYASSVGRWKHYEKHLGPVLSLESQA